jgi:hypothetical protein
MIVDVGNWPGLQADPSQLPITANGSPGMVPIVPGSGTPTTTTSTSTTPTVTAGATTNLGSTVADAIAHPSQHIFLIVIVALILWFLRST